MLPCNVIVQEHRSGSVEVSAVDPVASMQAIYNPRLAGMAKEVQAKLKRVVEDLWRERFRGRLSVASAPISSPGFATLADEKSNHYE
jgi:hypothetical protein